MRAAAWLLCTGSWLLFGCTRPDAGKPAAPAPTPGVTSPLSELAEEEIAAELLFSPTYATFLGDHRFDDRLDDVRPEAVAREIRRLRVMRERLRLLEKESGPGPGKAARLDLRLLTARVDGQLLEMTDPSPYEKNPIFYVNLIAFGLDTLLGPDFSPAEGRVRALSRRLQAVPEVCRDAQRNLRNPPELHTRRAIELAQMTRDFLATLLPRVVRGVGDPKLQEEFQHNSEEARRALEEFTGWLGRDLLPRCRGDGTLSRERLLARLRTLELLDVPLETVQAAAEREFWEVRRGLDEVARRLGSGSPAGAGGGRPLGEALRALEEDHPRPEELLQTAESTLGLLYETVSQQGLLTVPMVRPKVAEMPPYRWGFAVLHAPGPLEGRWREAYFYVDPVDPGWKEKRQVLEHLRLLNRTQLLLTAVHEVVPGHFAQQEALRRAAAGLPLLRQRSRSFAMSEGYAHYAEALMTEVWPGNDRLLLLALRGQLLRMGRLLTVLRLHGGIPPGPFAARLEEATRFLTEECFLDDYAARREVERAIYDPLCMLPPLGRLQILKLRQDYREEQGERFSLRSFHDALLAQGELPVPALRQLLLKNPGASLD